ncbi:glycosyltransferase family 2 protein [Puerhibacterium puerhi]|uniref:glycosyltransferase family 2 protein n=1 Tax=Puerhibacterium puerhi TaxID=2692623 RepID=UPI001359123E|nr:glycosyltransferase family A protein [Puerhibacterium puerhi]
MTAPTPAPAPGEQPRLTVGVPVFDGARYLAETLEALLAQDYRDLVVVVSDNASTDGTRAICEDFAARDPRVRYHREEVNRGGAWNFTRVLELARTELFAWNAADDVAAPGHLARCVAALDAHPEAPLAYDRVRLIGPDSEVIGELGDEDLDLTAPWPSARLEHFLVRQAVHIEYGVWRTGFLRAIGGEPEIRGGDVVLGARLLLRAPAVKVPEQLFFSRRHPEQGSVLEGLAQVQENRPDARFRLTFPQTRILVELVRSVLAAPLPPGERGRCLRAVVRGWAVPRRRSYASDVKQNLLALRTALRATARAAARRGRLTR